MLHVTTAFPTQNVNKRLKLIFPFTLEANNLISLHLQTHDHCLTCSLCDWQIQQLLFFNKHAKPLNIKTDLEIT